VHEDSAFGFLIGLHAELLKQNNLISLKRLVQFLDDSFVCSVVVLFIYC